MLKLVNFVVVLARKMVSFFEKVFFSIGMIAGLGLVILVILQTGSTGKFIRVTKESLGFNISDYVLPIILAFIIAVLISFGLSKILRGNSLDRLFFFLAFGFSPSQKEISGLVKSKKLKMILDVLKEQAGRINQASTRRLDFEKEDSGHSLSGLIFLSNRIYRSVDSEIDLFRKAYNLAKRLCPWAEKELASSRWSDYLS